MQKSAPAPSTPAWGQRSKWQHRLTFFAVFAPGIAMEADPAQSLVVPWSSKSGLTAGFRLLSVSGIPWLQVCVS